MADSKLQAAERAVARIFSDDYRFFIPLYQRPYAWTDEQAGEMYDDLLDASKNQPEQDPSPYFLGSIVVVRGQDAAHCDVVDGQQRLTTLTILLAALRDRLPDLADDIEKRLFQKGDQLLGTIDKPRIELRPEDQPFFEKHILESGGVEALESLDVGLLPDSQQRIAENALVFNTRLATLNDEQSTQLVRYLITQTVLVVVATRDFESAYRIFTVLNERGLNLTHTDILKSEIVGAIPPDEQAGYNAKWTREENDLGREAFADLFSHIRMVFAKSKARESILKEFRSEVVSVVPDPRQLIDEVIVPLSDAFEVVTKCDFAATSGATEVNQMLGWLNLLDNSDWIPPAIRFFAAKPDAETAARFTTQLERLAASMFVRRVDMTRRIERYGRVLTAIENGEDLGAEESPMQLTAAEKLTTRERLDDEIYSVKRIQKYVPMRLDSTLSAGGVTFDHPVVSVEHVLPQNPAEQSDWRAWFTDEQREYWTHRLANLVLLTRRKNSEASNYDFAKKKEKYFTSDTGVSVFALTTQVLGHDEWNPELLAHRQAELVQKLSDLWQL